MSSEYYFAFGSNMDRDQMRTRVPGAEYVGIGRVIDHDLAFNRQGSYRPGGVASIVPRSGIDAYGVVWRLGAAQLSELDRIEDPAAYQRVEKLVRMNDGSELTCNVYVAFPEADLPADQPYLELIIKAAESAGLPDHWIDWIKTFRIPKSPPAGEAVDRR